LTDDREQALAPAQVTQHLQDTGLRGAPKQSQQALRAVKAARRRPRPAPPPDEAFCLRELVLDRIGAVASCYGRLPGNLHALRRPCRTPRTVRQECPPCL